MTDHSMLLNAMEIDVSMLHRANERTYSDLRAKMAGMYGEERISRFEQSVNDGDGIQIVIENAD